MTDLPFIAFFADPECIVDILAGQRRRPWMDEEGGHAYKCLPLAMANEHGWTLGSPNSFEAEWNGGPGKDDVKVRVDQDQPSFVYSHFTPGILSFSVSIIFRTPPGYNLWLGPPANHFKDGIQTMSALIETDWMPYIFSVNWKFTRPNTPIRFEKGDPICSVFPVPRGLVEQFATDAKFLTEDPETQRQYETGVLRRQSFEVLKKLNKEPDGALKHQRWYTLGTTPDGKREFPEHQTSLKVRSFPTPNKP